MNILDGNGLAFLWQQIKKAIPVKLPNPYPIKFSGFINGTYDGSKSTDIQFPPVTVYNQVTGTPVGEVMAFLGNSIPENYLALDGQSHLIDDYPELANLFKVEFGSSNYFGGDGVKTFAVPDYRWRFPRNGESNYLDSPEWKIGSTQEATIFPHISNSGADINGTLSGVEISNADGQGGSADSSYYAKTGTYTSAGRYTWFTARPMAFIVNYVIKAKSTYTAIIPYTNYSYDEHYIGMYLGNTLYEKTIAFGLLPNNATKEVKHNIANIKKIWIYDGNIYRPTDPYVYPLYWHSAASINANIEWEVSPTSIIASTSTEGDWSSYNCVVTLRYTK